MTTYIPITKSQMDQAIGAFKRPPDRTSMNPRQEVTHDWNLGRRNQAGPRLAVRLFTSLVPSEDTVRACGKDAIRVAVIASPGGARERLLCSLTRVHRVPGWADRMKARLCAAWKLVRRSPECPACGAFMAPRAVRAEKGNKRSPVKRLFWACTSCRGTRSAQKVDDGNGGSRPPRTHEELLSTLRR